MPFFQITKDTATRVPQTNFALERELHNLIEKNLEVFFNCRFVASEFSTGVQHSGRIDTLALSEENNPVIIEYKKVESSDLLNQALFYLSWIQDHKGDYELAVKKSIGPNTIVDWSEVRVICIAPNYKKYDLHAVTVMAANIELWQYRLYENGAFYFEEIYKPIRSHRSSSKAQNDTLEGTSDSASSVPTFESHLNGKPDFIVRWANDIREFIFSLDEHIEEVPRKMYIAYRASSNIAGIEYQRKSIGVYLKLKPEDIDVGKEIYRDVTNIGTYAPGKAEFTITEDKHLEIVKHYIRKAYNKLGG